MTSKLASYVGKRSLAVPLLVLMAATFLLVPPRGNFPQNDDWVHAKAVERLLEDGYYRGHPFCTSTLVGQVYWGALFAKAFGLDFNTLRASTLVLSFFLAWGVALCAREFGVPRRLALLCGAIAWANPVVLVLSYSFMLDVPFLTMTVLSGFFFLRAMRLQQARFILLGSLFGGLAYSIRQPGLLLPIAYASTIGALCFKERKWPHWQDVAAFAAPLILGFLLLAWVTRAQESGTSYPFDIQAAGILDGALRFLRFAVIAMVYTGLFVSPLGGARLWQMLRGQEPRPVPRIVFLLGYAVVSFLLFWYPAFSRMPFQTSYLYDLGLAPITLHDVYIEHRTWAPFQIGKWWWLITLGSVGAAGCAVLAALHPVREFLSPNEQGRCRKLRMKQGLFIVIWGALILGSLNNPWLWLHDRYLIAGIPPFLVLLAKTLQWQAQPGVRRVACTAALCLYAFSLAGTQDFMAWNNARWDAIDRLQTDHGAPLTAINGGYEFYGWHTSDDFMERNNSGDFWEFFGRDGRWVIDDTYVLGMIAPRPEYNILFREPYFSWLGMKTRNIYVFERTNAE